MKNSTITLIVTIALIIVSLYVGVSHINDKYQEYIGSFNNCYSQAVYNIGVRFDGEVCTNGSQVLLKQYRNGKLIGTDLEKGKTLEGEFDSVLTQIDRIREDMDQSYYSGNTVQNVVIKGNFVSFDYLPADGKGGVARSYTIDAKFFTKEVENIIIQL